MEIKYALGTVAVISSITAEEHLDAIQFAPETLSIRNEKGNVVYVVADEIHKGIAKPSPFGFAPNQIIDGKLAYCVNVATEEFETEEDIKGFVTSVLGPMSAALVTHEATIKAQIDAAVTPVKAVADNMEFI